MALKRIALISLVVAGTTLTTLTFADEQTNLNTKTTVENTKAMTNETQLTDKEFLEANKSKPNVQTLPDGLQYKVIKVGTGVKPKATDTVTVHYAGRHIDGSEFDSSYQRGEPANFPVDAVIAGWTEALQLMNVGSEWELYIPASLAYGSHGMPPVIAPNETLIFKVELLAIK